jgi:hypothetical protein
MQSFVFAMRWEVPGPQDFSCRERPAFESGLLERISLVGAIGFELEAFTRRLSRVPKSREESRDLEVWSGR